MSSDCDFAGVAVDHHHVYAWGERIGAVGAAAADVIDIGAVIHTVYDDAAFSAIYVDGAVAAVSRYLISVGEVFGAYDHICTGRQSDALIAYLRSHIVGFHPVGECVMPLLLHQRIVLVPVIEHAVAVGAVPL